MGMDWSLREGYIWAEDKEHCEEYGRMLQADPSKVSMRAKKRGLPQVSLSVKCVSAPSSPYLQAFVYHIISYSKCTIFSWERLELEITMLRFKLSTKFTTSSTLARWVSTKRVRFA